MGTLFCNWKWINFFYRCWRRPSNFLGRAFSGASTIAPVSWDSLETWHSIHALVQLYLYSKLISHSHPLLGHDLGDDMPFNYTFYIMSSFKFRGPKMTIFNLGLKLGVLNREGSFWQRCPLRDHLKITCAHKRTGFIWEGVNFFLLCSFLDNYFFGIGINKLKPED
jgi:hypothetical protein